MEGSESEALFDSLNLNPQLFLNETLNTIDDLVDDAFNFYHQQASTLLKTDGSEKSDDLRKGIDHIRNMIQSSLDKRLGMWEKYSLHHCFTVPDGFSLHKSCEANGDASLLQDAVQDPNLDVQLDSLRAKLITVRKESVDLSRELQALERQSASSGHCAGLVNDVLQLYVENSMHDKFQDMVRVASELRTKMEKLKTSRTEDIEHRRAEKIHNPNEDSSTMSSGKGLSNLKLEDLQGFLADLEKM